MARVSIDCRLYAQLLAERDRIEAQLPEHRRRPVSEYVAIAMLAGIKALSEVAPREPAGPTPPAPLRLKPDNASPYYWPPLPTYGRRVKLSPWPPPPLEPDLPPAPRASLRAAAVRPVDGLTPPTGRLPAPAAATGPHSHLSVDPGFMPDPDVCAYCGSWAESVDHLLSRVWTGEAGRATTPTVPACLSCNSLLGTHHEPTIAGRRAIVYGALIRRHRRLLNVPTWTDDQLAEFSDRLRDQLRDRERQRRHLQARLANLARLEDERPELIETANG